MSDQTVTPDSLLDAIERRFDALEQRFVVQEEYTSRILSLLERLAEHLGISEQ